MSQALYRKYRSLTLDDVLGQEHIVSILRRALEKGRVAHAYLLSGPRGTGKTSVARILAHHINQLPYDKESSHIDIIEIDAASNNGVDDIRNLREKSRIAPVTAQYKVYIIDEVHMLSKSAFNALLKTLEEPPEHIVFIMATTDADKLPATILSRVQQYHFHPITSSVIAAHLMDIAKKEGFTLEKSAAELIAERGNGGFRDSIGMLDQLSNLVGKGETLTEAAISANLGLADSQLIQALLDAYLAGDAAGVMSHLEAVEQSGTSTRIIVEQLLKAAREQLTEHPELTHLMGDLVDVPNHAYPDMKLLTTLTSHLAPAPAKPAPVSRPAAVVAPQPVATKPVKEQATAVEEPQPTYAPEPKKVTSSAELSEFNWTTFIDAVRQESIGLYSLLAKCGFDTKLGSLVIYGGTSFTKKKLEDAKNMQIIASILSATYGDNVEISIKSSKKPPEDDTLAAVAEMLGGGEEVSLEDIA